MNRPAFLYTRYLPTAAVVATDSRAGTAPGDVLYATEDTFWRPANQAGDKAITVDFGEVRLCDRLGIVGDNLDGVLVDLRGSSDNFVADDVLLAEAVTLAAAANAASVPFDQTSFRYGRLEFKVGFFPSNVRLAHLCWDRQRLLPWLSEDFDPDALDAEGEFLVSRQGLYLGSEQERAMRPLALSLGQVTEAEYVNIAHWAKSCIGRLEPFFFIPDIDAERCYFGWAPDKKFNAPLQQGLRQIPTIKMLARAQ